MKRMKGKQGQIPMIISAVLSWSAASAGPRPVARRLDGRWTHRPRRRAIGLLALALLIALGFEFVNGFHDTANAVATVIYTHSLEPHIAVMWSGMWNLIGVLTSSGAVAFAHRLPAARGVDPQGRLCAPASPWCSPCSFRPSCGTSARGGSACRPPAHTPSLARSSVWASPTS